MRKITFLLSVFFLLSTCKKDEQSTVLVNATVANSSEGSVDFKSGDYSIGSSITFSATPKTGYSFVNWTDASTNQTYSTNPLSITVNENTTLIANFEKAAYNIMFDISGEGSVQKEVVGGGEFTHGSQVELTATPADDYSFFYWNNDPGDTENPKTITLDSDQNIPAKFDYEVAKDLVGTWEFEISDPASKNVTIIKMSIDISLNVLMTTIVNGEVISQIFTQMIAISTTAILIGDFAVITNVVVATATSLSMNMIPIPEDTAPPTNESEIPESGSQLNLSGKKSDEEPEKDEDGVIIPPAEATTASSTTEDVGAIFEQSFDKLVGVQSSTLASDTLESGTATSTTGAASQTNCTITTSLISAALTDQQSVAAGSPITDIVYDIISDCPQITHLVASNGLPPGVSASIINDDLKIMGTPSGQSSGVYNYSITLDNHLEQTSTEPFVSATTSTVVNGSIIVTSTGTTTSTDCSVSENIPPPLQLAGGTTANVVTETGKYFEIKYENGVEHTGGGYNITWDNQPDNVVVEGYVVGLKIKGNPSTVGTYNYTLTSNSIGGNESNCNTAPVSGTLTVLAATTTNTTDTSTSTNTGTNSSTTGNGNNCTITTSLNTAALTDQQSVPAGTSITDIIYDIISDCPQIIHLVASNGLPPGVSASVVAPSSPVLIIQGTPSGQSSGVYNYSIILDNHLEQTSTEPFVSATTSTVVNGSITITSSGTNTSTSTNTGTTSSNTIDELVLTSSQNTLNQSICAQSPISPIILQLGGDASSVNVTGLPNGISSAFDVSQNNITISGTPPIGVSSATTYIYNVTSNGSQSKTVSGSITVNPDSNIVLISQLGTASQTMNIGNPIFDIIYQFGGGATSVNVSGLPNGVAATVNQNNQVILSGQPILSNNAATNEVYNFTITTIGNQYGCGEDSISSSINIINSGTNSSTTSSNTNSAETYTIDVTASNSSNYTLGGTDRSGSVSGSDPSVTINVSDTLNFAIDASGHPFYLKTVQGTGTSDLISGVTNNGATNGTVSWTPTSAGTYYYQCSLHNGMNGTIIVQ